MRKKTIRRIGALILLAWMIGFSSISSLHAAPGLINFQGQLSDSGGTPVNTTATLIFNIYDADTAGALLWGETQTNVDVQNGIYNVLLGSVTFFPASLFTSDVLWFEIVVNGETLSPRQRITSVAFALEAGHAGTADTATTAGNADTLDGLDSTDLEESAEIDADIVTHAANASAHHVKTTSFTELADQASDAQIPDNITVNYAATAGDANTLDGSDSTAFASSIHNHDTEYYTKAYVDSLETRIANLEDLLQHFSRSGNDITVSGANLHIINGNGSTNGAVNGLGNLIIGYNELRGGGNDFRIGSHNLAVGSELNYMSYGGIVAGSYNEISGQYASVTGGTGNKASGDYSSVSGGSNNQATNNTSSVSGGFLNTASGSSSWIGGGYLNTSSYNYSSISGGESNTSNALGSSISGGYGNSTTASYSSVSGGSYNIASGDYSSVSGGSYNIASGNYAFVAGGGGDINWKGNQAFADYSSILGGFRNITGDDLLINHVIGLQSTISGGSYNISSGDTSSILGGWFNEATERSSSVSGGLYNTASGWYSSVSGGELNTASGDQSTVSGGESNTAIGWHSSVSGGKSRSTLNDWNWAAGSLLENQ